MTKEETREEIRKSAGTQFDPYMAEVVLEHIGEFEEIHSRFQDA
jgi:response regulator RpfG family c-di-GMP phosphodiesterase